VNCEGGMRQEMLLGPHTSEMKNTTNNKVGGVGGGVKGKGLPRKKSWGVKCSPQFAIRGKGERLPGNKGC